MTGACLEDTIRAYADAGYSRSATADLLGVNYQLFREVIRDMPSINWPSQGRSAMHKAYYARRSSMPLSDEQRAQLNRLHQMARGTGDRFVVRGHEGSIEELVDHFGVAVHVSTVRRRLANGADIEAALFNPPTPRNMRRVCKEQAYASPCP